MLLPGLPTQIAAKLRYSKVVVVSVYVAPAVGDRAAAAEARKGARAAGAGFAAVNVANDKNATAMASFVGAVSSPTMLVVRRPGKIVTQIAGPVEAAVVDAGGAQRRRPRPVSSPSRAPGWSRPRPAPPARSSTTRCAATDA